MSEILIIDDKNELPQKITKILQNRGFGLKQTSCGKHILERTTNSAIDFTSADVVFPFTDIDKIFDRKENKTTPFVFDVIKQEKSISKQRDHQKESSKFCFSPISGKDCPFIKNEIEKELKSVRKKIIYSIPHEMYTPLHSILSMGKLIYEGTDYLSANEISELGDGIVKSAFRLQELVRKYIMYIDIETKGTSFKRKTVQLMPEYFQDLVFNVAKKYDRLNDFAVETDNNTFILQIKEDWFCFALTELIDNAFKFSKKGQKVNFKLKKTGQNCEMIIHDEGCGFPCGAINEIGAFTQFNRKKHEQQGIGLGIYLAKKVIDLHNGNLQIKSNPNTGTFCLCRLSLY